MAEYNAIPSENLSQQFLSQWKDFASLLKKKKTRYEYLSEVNRLCNTYGKDFLSLSEDQVRSYFESLARKGLTAKTIQGKLSCFKSIASFMEQNIGEGWENPFTRIQVESFSEFISPSSVPTLSELDTIMTHARKDSRLFLAFSLILRCGLSASEISSLRAEMFQIDGLDRMFLRISSGRRERKIKIPEDVAGIFLDYAESEGIFSGPLLYNKKGKPLSYHALCDLVRNCMQEAGFAYTMQDLRNLSMAHMLNGGAPSSDVAAYAGISKRWLYRQQEVLAELDVAPCDYQCFQIKSNIDSRNLKTEN